MSDDLGDLVRELRSAAANIDPRALVKVEALNVKREWQQAWSGIRGLPHIGQSVTFEAKDTRAGAEAEIGPDPARTQGPLDNIVEFGSSQHGPIRPVTRRLVEAAGDRLEAYLARQAEEAL